MVGVVSVILACKAGQARGVSRNKVKSRDAYDVTAAPVELYHRLYTKSKCDVTANTKQQKRTTSDAPP